MPRLHTISVPILCPGGSQTKPTLPDGNGETYGNVRLTRFTTACPARSTKLRSDGHRYRKRCGAEVPGLHRPAWWPRCGG